MKLRHFSVPINRSVFDYSSSSVGRPDLFRLTVSGSGHADARMGQVSCYNYIKKN